MARIHAQQNQKQSAALLSLSSTPLIIEVNMAQEEKSIKELCEEFGIELGAEE